MDTSNLEEVIRLYKFAGGSEILIRKARKELKNLKLSNYRMKMYLEAIRNLDNYTTQIEIADVIDLVDNKLF